MPMLGLLSKTGQKKFQSGFLYTALSILVNLRSKTVYFHLNKTMDKSFWTNCKYIFALLLITALSVGACSGDKSDDHLAPDNSITQEESPYLNITVADTVFIKESTTDITISFSTNKNWTAVSNQQWCILSATNGNKGSNTITAKANSNTEYNKREAKITIKAENISKELVIQQDKLHNISVEKEQYNASYKGDTLIVKVSANLEYNISYKEDWIKIQQYTETRSMESKELKCIVYPNLDTQERSATIIIRNNEKNLEKKITITQDAYPKIIDGGNPNGNIGNMEWN